MQANYVQRLRLTFSKNGPARYIGHLDLARTLERAFNRAEIPIAYTQGFNRRPRMAFASPLPLGFTGERELLDIWLTTVLKPKMALEKIMSKMAPGIEITQIDEVALKAPSLQAITSAASYSAMLLDPVNKSELENCISQLLETKKLLRLRQKGKGRVKEYDLRPLIVELKFSETAENYGLLTMKLLLMVGKTGRPDELLRALELDPYAARICRTKIFLNLE